MSTPTMLPRKDGKCELCNSADMIKPLGPRREWVCPKCVDTSNEVEHNDRKNSSGK